MEQGFPVAQAFSLWVFSPGSYHLRECASGVVRR